MRLAARLSARDLSELAGLAPSYVAKLERGAAANPTATSLASLAQVLGCSVGWLAAGEGEAPAMDAVLRAVAAAFTRRLAGAAAKLIAPKTAGCA